MDNKLKIMTYNSTGMAPDRIDFIRQICNKYKPDVLLLQETWLLESRLNVIRGIDSQYLANGIAAVHENELLHGRPKCGLGIMWKKCLSKTTKFLNIPNTVRACALEIKNNDECFICINVYMPVDNYCKTRVSLEFQDTLDAIELFVQQCSGKQIIIGGDINIDVKRANAHDKCFLDFIERNNLVYTPTLGNCYIDYTYHDPNVDCFSCIDHFSVSRLLANSVERVYKCDEPVNPSYHVPLNIDLNLQMCRTNHINSKSQTTLPICWHKISDDDVLKYQDRQRRYLNNMSKYDVVGCIDVTCTNNDHKKQIDVWCRDLIKLCLESDCDLPRVKSKVYARPNWNDDVKPYRVVFFGITYGRMQVRLQLVYYMILKSTLKNNICMLIEEIGERWIF